MTKAELIAQLDHVNHSKEKRSFYSKLFMDHPEDIATLLKVAFDTKEKKSFRAAWVLEFICSSDIAYILPHLEYFSEHLGQLQSDSAKRPAAKICELLTTAYYKKADDRLLHHFKQIHKEQIIEACFDWMIQEEKVAVKAYSMNSLYLLGTEYDWIHPDLISILKKDFAGQSAAFKARSRHILKRLKA